MALFAEDYTISVARSGDASIRNLALTGWGNALATVSEAGRLYWSVTSGNTLELYRNEARAAGDLVASGAINASTHAVTLAQANSSGLSGSATVVHTSGLAANGEVILSYADEPELASELQHLTSLLDGSSQWEGGRRFEKALRQAKRTLDAALIGQLQHRLPRTAAHLPDLSAIAQPRQLAEVHAKLTASLLFEQRGVHAPINYERAERKRRDAHDLLKNIALALDLDNNDSVDDRPSLSSGSVRRG